MENERICALVQGLMNARGCRAQNVFRVGKRRVPKSSEHPKARSLKISGPGE